MVHPVPGKRSPHRGFTLVEVLIALTILSLMLGTLFGSLRVTSRSWAAAAGRADVNESMRLGMDFLRRGIEQAVPLRNTGDEGERLLFIGSPGRLQFVSPLPAHTGGAVLYWLMLEWRAADGKQGDLVLRYRPLHQMRAPVGDAGTETDFVEEVSVLEDLGAVAFRYYGRPRAGDPPDWHDHWRNASRLPELVRIDLTPASSRVSWPALVVAPRVDDQPGRGPFAFR